MGSIVEKNKKPNCAVTPLPGIGERRRYRHIVQPFAAHAHDYYVVELVEEGARSLVCNGRNVVLLPGDLVVFNPGDVHSCAQRDESVFAYDSVTIDATLLDGARLAGPRVRDTAAVAVFRDLLHAADSADKTRIAEYTLQLCELLLDENAAKEPSYENDGAARRVMAHFCGHLADAESLEELASREGLSTYALIRAYRTCFSITPMKHLASLRVECAARLLRSGVEPAVVAAEVGFADQPHLTRVFKQRMGVTPAAYQRMVCEGGARP